MKQILINIWRYYKEIAGYIGDFQARLLLIIFYFFLALPFGLLARIILDPLQIKKRWITTGWIRCEIKNKEINEAQHQF